MPRGNKKSYGSKQRRVTRSIEESSKKRGTAVKRGASMAYGTVTAQEGGGKKGGSGRGHGKTTSSGRKGGVKTGRAAARRGAARGRGSRRS